MKYSAFKPLVSNTKLHPYDKMRAEKERELKELEGAYSENTLAEKERKLSTKYHKVKFFERVKITRAIEKLEKKNKDAGGKVGAAAVQAATPALKAPPGFQTLICEKGRDSAFNLKTLVF